MRFKITTLLALVVTCSLVVAASASAALPEFKGTFPQRFQATISPPLFERPSGEHWLYESGRMEGEITGPNTVVGIWMSFKHSSNWEYACDNVKEGTETGNRGLKFEKLTGRLGYINKTTKEVGLLITAPTQPWGKCTNDAHGTKLEYMGQLIGKIGPINTKNKFFSMKYAQNKGKGTPSFFEGEKESGTKYPLSLGKCTYIEGICISFEPTVGIESLTDSIEIVEKELEIAA